MKSTIREMFKHIPEFEKTESTLPQQSPLLVLSYLFASNVVEMQQLPGTKYLAVWGSNWWLKSKVFCQRVRLLFGCNLEGRLKDLNLGSVPVFVIGWAATLPVYQMVYQFILLGIIRKNNKKIQPLWTCMIWYLGWTGKY